jgi:hypothetical protein
METGGGFDAVTISTSTKPSEPSVPLFADVSVISPDVFQFRKLR